MANEIHDVVDGSRAKPADTLGPNEARTKTWLRDDAKARAIISSVMEYTQLECVLICTTAKEMWDALSRVHEQKSSIEQAGSHTALPRV